MHKAHSINHAELSAETGKEILQELKTALEVLELPTSSRLWKRWTALDRDLSADADVSETIVFKFVKSDLINALASGSFIVFDNINAALPNVIEAILSLFEEEPSLNLSKHSEGEQLTLHNGIHPATRLFATADLKRINTFKLSSPLMNRMIKIWLPEIDGDMAGLTLEEMESHEVTEIVAKSFSSFAGGQLAATLCAFFYSRIKEMSLTSEISVSKDCKITFRMLQQSVAVISTWLRKGEPLFNAVVWGLCRTYAAVMEHKEDFKKLQAVLRDACLETSALPLHKFYAVPSSKDSLTPFESESRELQLIFASFIQIAMRVSVRAIIQMRNRYDFKKALKNFLSLALKIYPEIKDTVDKLCREIDSHFCDQLSFRERCSEYECVALAECCKEITDHDKKKISFISKEFGRIIHMCKRFLYNSSFTDWQQRRDFLNDMASVLKEVISMLDGIAAQGCPDLAVMKTVASGLYRMRHFVHYCHALEQETFTDNVKRLNELQMASKDNAFNFNLKKRLSEAVVLSDSKLLTSIVRLSKDAGASKTERNQIALCFSMTALDWKTTLYI